MYDQIILNIKRLRENFFWRFKLENPWKRRFFFYLKEQNVNVTRIGKLCKIRSKHGFVFELLVSRNEFVSRSAMFRTILPTTCDRCNVRLVIINFFFYVNKRLGRRLLFGVRKMCLNCIYLFNFFFCTIAIPLCAPRVFGRHAHFASSYCFGGKF